MNGHSLPCFSAPAATLAALTESGPRKLSVRASSLILPARTYFSIRAGRVECEASAQTGHWRSRYSVTVIGALGSPSIPFFSVMPANIEAALVTELPLAALSED